MKGHRLTNRSFLQLALFALTNVLAKRIWRHCAVIVALAVLGAQEPPRLRPLPKASQNLKTGPDVGSSVPLFTLLDQYGAPRDFDNLRGKKGLVLVFVRSADW